MDTRDRALAIWEAPECPYTIEYSVRVLDDIRLAVTDAFYSLARGGVEIGGIFLGRHLPGRVTIEGYVPLDCEHAFGPSFTLSPNDQTKLEELLTEARRSSVTTPVGWYHSHTRSEVFFSAVDMEVHRRFFPERWQVALVVRPRTAGPTDAGFFFSEADGSIHGESSYAGFTLENLPIQPVPAAQAPARVRLVSEPLHNGPVVDLEATQPIVSPPVPIEISNPHPVAVPVETFEESPAIEISEPEPEIPEESAPVEETVETWAPAPEAAANLPAVAGAGRARELSVPNFTVEPPRSRAWIASIAITAVLAAGATAYTMRDKWVPSVREMTAKMPWQSNGPSQPAPVPVPVQVTPSSSVGFNAIDTEGQLLLRWDRSSPLILTSTGALLVIGDGAAPPQAVGLDVAHLKTGSFTYARQTGHVELTLTVHLPNGQDLKENATFLGQPPTGLAAAPGDSHPQDTADQASKLQKQEARNKKLERTIEDMRRELKKERQRRRLENQAPDAVKK